MKKVKTINVFNHTLILGFLALFFVFTVDKVNAAQFSTDFSEYASNQFPNDWTAQWHASTSMFTVVDDPAAMGGKSLRLTHSANERYAISWNDVGSVTDAEIVIRFKMASVAQQQVRAYLRGQGTSTSEDGYYLNLPRTSNTSGYEILEYNNNAGSTVTTETTQSYSANTWYWARFRASGNTLQARVWQDGTSEPSTWTLSATDSTNSTAGWVGLGFFESNGSNYKYIDYVGVGTNGDSAPLYYVTTTGVNSITYNFAGIEGILINTTTNNVSVGVKFGSGAGYASTPCKDLPGDDGGGSFPPGTHNHSFTAVPLTPNTITYACRYVRDQAGRYYYSDNKVSFTTAVAPAPAYNYAEMTAIDSTSALVGISVNPYGVTPAVTVRWGAGAAYSGTACASLPNSASVSNPSGAQFDQGVEIPYSYRITGLTPGQPFYWCYQVTASGTNVSTKYSSTAATTSASSCDLLPGSVAGSTEKSRLAMMLGSTHLKGTLLYKATISGWTYANFHSAVDGQGENVVIIRNSANNNIIGFYMPSSWSSVGSYATGSNAFLFSLTNNYKLNSLRGSHIAYLNASQGIYVGAGNDLRAALNPMNNSNSFYTSAGTYYEAPSSKGAFTYLNGGGSFQFTPNEIEVFAISTCTTSVPVLSDPTETSTSFTSTTLGATVDSDGGSAITERGVCYALTATDSTPGFTTATGSTPESGVTCMTTSGTTGLFTIPITGLSASSQYTYRGFARNGIGNGYSSTGTFTTPTNAPTSVTTNNESGLASYKVTLNGSANPNGSQAYGYFRYFTSAPNCTVDSGGTRVPSSSTQDYNLGSGSSPVSFNITTSPAIPLVRNTNYWYCAYSRNAAAGAGSPGTSAAAGYDTFTTPDGPASGCDAPATGNLTISEPCTFPQSDYDGVDAGGSGTSNTAVITLSSGGNITILPGQRVARGGVVMSGGSFAIGNGNGGFIRGGLWLKDSDGDGIIDNPVVKTVNAAQPAGYIRRNYAYTLPQYNTSTFNYASKFYNATSTALDCDSTNGNIYQNVANMVVDSDQDGYKTSASASTQCVGDTQTAGGRTYYRNASGSYTWLSTSQQQGGGATDCTDSSAAPCAPSLNSVSTNSQTSLSANWTAWSSTVGPQPTSYNLYYCDRTSNGSCTPNSPIGGSISSAASTYNHNSGITCGRTYAYLLRAVNASGTSTDSTVRTGATSSCVSAPTVVSPTHSSVTGSSATLGATVSSDGGASITDRGTCWGTTNNPSTNCQSAGGTTGAFTHSRTGMPANTLIYYRGYATNSVNTSYSPSSSFTTLGYPRDTFTDTTGVLLENHTMDVGSGWTKLIDNGTGNIQISSNAIADASGTDISSAGELYVTNDTISTANYKVSATMTTGDSTDDYNIIAGRVQDANNMYAVEFNNSQIELWVKVGGSWGSGPIGTAASGASNGSVITLNMDGSNISVLDDGTPVILASNNQISGAGKAGIGIGNIVSSGGDFSTQVLDTFEVDAAQTGVCINGYLDSDGDGYGAGSYSCKTVGPVVANNTDCYDSNASARPNQTGYFTAQQGHRGDGSWDYDCSNSIQYQIADTSGLGGLAGFCPSNGQPVSYSGSPCKNAQQNVSYMSVSWSAYTDLCTGAWTSGCTAGSGNLQWACQGGSGTTATNPANGQATIVCGGSWVANGPGFGGPDTYYSSSSTCSFGGNTYYGTHTGNFQGCR